MDAQVTKMAKFFRVSDEVASALIKAGFRTPRQVKATEDSCLLAVRGVGDATFAKLRER